MSDTKFTPGPWVVNESIGNYSYVETKSGSTVCDTSSEYSHLIAAAPDLYELVNKLKDTANYIHRDNIVLMCEEVLAKARGEK